MAYSARSGRLTWSRPKLCLERLYSFTSYFHIASLCKFCKSKPHPLFQNLRSMLAIIIIFQCKYFLSEDKISLFIF